MATVSVTNQTLTMTIDIDGIETVIRKDNCKVQSFGQMVRITDYKGSIYEFLYSDCTAPSEPNANDLRDAIEAFLNTGGGGGGGGITTITSTDGSVDIDLSNSSAPDLSIPSGTFTPEESNVTDNATLTMKSGFYYRIGDFVTMVFVLDVALDAAADTTVFNFSLPIVSDFPNDKQMVVTCNIPTNLASLVGQSDGVEDKGRIAVFGNANGDLLEDLQISATYKILP